MKKIAVLTYPVKHRKTYDVLCLLKASGYSDVKVYAIPFRYQKKKQPLIKHRPDMHFQVPEVKEMCANLGYQYYEGKLDELLIGQERIVLIAGAGILPHDFINTHIVINSHPGYLPNCRGLDAFKWAIKEKQPIGVTTHLLGDYVDAGVMIERRRIDVYRTDTFHAVAQRVYENEITMLIEAIGKYDKLENEIIYPGEYELHKRMPEEMEDHLLEYFDDYKDEFAICDVLS